MLEGGEKSSHAVLAGNTRRVVLRLPLPSECGYYQSVPVGIPWKRRGLPPHNPKKLPANNRSHSAYVEIISN